jgi:hypothetical protein
MKKMKRYNVLKDKRLMKAIKKIYATYKGEAVDRFHFVNIFSNSNNKNNKIGKEVSKHLIVKLFKHYDGVYWEALPRNEVFEPLRYKWLGNKLNKMDFKKCKKKITTTITFEEDDYKWLKAQDGTMSDVLHKLIKKDR